MKTLFYFLILFTFANVSIAQINIDDVQLNEFIILTLNDGTEITGEVIAIEEDKLIIATASLGQIDVSTYQINKLSLIDPSMIRKDGSIRFKNPMASKNYLTETAIGLKKGEGFYQNILLGAHTFSYGVSDRFTIGGGFETFSLFAGNTPAVFVAPKITLPASGSVHFGVGANLAMYSNNGFTDVFGSVYGITTIGNSNHNFTVGLGFAYVNDNLADTPIIQLGGMTRLSKHFMIVADNFILSDVSFYGGGTWSIRYITPKVSVDLGAAISYEGGGGIPILGASIRF